MYILYICYWQYTLKIYLNFLIYRELRKRSWKSQEEQFRSIFLFCTLLLIYSSCVSSMLGQRDLTCTLGRAVLLKADEMTFVTTSFSYGVAGALKDEREEWKAKKKRRVKRLWVNNEKTSGDKKHEENTVSVELNFRKRNSKAH